tara:strand:- start:6372 stop:7004 length:633 start_codon:yes stop_codon:yes gene_type:complete
MSSFEKSRSVISSTSDKIKEEKGKIPAKYKNSNLLSDLSEDHLNKVDPDILKNKGKSEKKRTYELGLLQLAGIVESPKQYYTIMGDIIKNPLAYAKTGAPMYGSHKYLLVDLNQKMYIYKLNLEEGKVYIGKTNNIKRRIEEHFSGKGSQVTKKFKPINYEILDVCDGYFSNKEEQKYTNEYIKRLGYENVRGGKYTNSRTLKSSYKSVR